MQLLIDYAIQFVGIPYIWGGKTPHGYDCSGLVQELLASVGMDIPGDQSAQAFYNHFSKQAILCQPKAGALIFFGKDDHSVSHIGFMLDANRMIEAGGGDHTCIDPQKSLQKRAFVRIRTINHRSDVISVFMPNYPFWLNS